MVDTITKEAKFLSGYVYHNEKYTKNYGFQLLEKSEDLGNGFYAESYYKNGRIYVVYRGKDTDMRTKQYAKESVKDLLNDAQLFLKTSPSQYINAKRFYDYTARVYRNYPIYATGHSLGGSLAQMAASSVKEVKAITFNAYGTGSIKKNTPKYPENVVNYGNEKDPIFKANIRNQVGKTFVTEGESRTGSWTTKYHPVEYVGDLDSAKEYKSLKQKATVAKNDMKSILISQKQANIDIVHKKLQEHEEKLKKKKQAAQRASGKGRWVTMNGAHVFIED